MQASKGRRGMFRSCAFILATLVSVGLSVAPLTVAARSVQGSALVAEPLTAASPDSVAPAVRARLSPTRVTVSTGGHHARVLVRERAPDQGVKRRNGVRSPRARSPACSGSPGPFKEIRGKTVPPGIYTLRLGLQPQNGDHPRRVALSRVPPPEPRRRGQRPEAARLRSTVALSKQTLSASHPAALSIDSAVVNRSGIVGRHQRDGPQGRHVRDPDHVRRVEGRADPLLA